MTKLSNFNIAGLNLRISPFIINDGEMIKSVNVVTDQIGAKKKRPGYTTFLTNTTGSQVNGIFDWQRNDGTTFNLYKASGDVLEYSLQGTGAWTVCGNGTFSSGFSPGHAVLEDTLIVGDGTTSTRHSTDGTSFTNTVAAPIANYFSEYQQRIWAGGTASKMFYSTTGTPTDWITDSSSISIPGPGKINSLFKNNDRLVSTKNSGNMFRYDGFSLIDMSTDLGPTSSNAIDSVENFNFWPNRLGVFNYGGINPTLVSSSIQKQIYNDFGSGVQGTVFDNSPGVVHRYDYLWAVGTVTDDFTKMTLNNCIEKYDYQLDEWTNWNFGTLPTAFCSYKDTNKVQQLVFGDSLGQCYTYGGTVTHDNGLPVEVTMEFVITAGNPDLEKKWNFLWLFFNPGNEAKVQVAVGNTLTPESKKWVDIGDCSDGVKEFRMLNNPRGRFLFLKIYESSRNSRFNFYGYSYSFDTIVRE